MAKKAKKSSSNQLEVQNASKTLLANIRFLSPDKPVKTIAITSSVPNEGKSTIALNLAQSIASSGQSVLVVDADMRRRSLGNYLKLTPTTGMYSVLSGQTKIKDAVVSTPISNLYFLDIEPNIPNPADILSSRRFKDLVKILEESFKYVIFDTPPVGTFVDAAILGTLVDGVLFVVKPKHTKRKEMQFAYDQLLKADVNILGACANYCESVGSEYYYAYYTAAGKRVKDGAATDLLLKQSGEQSRAPKETFHKQPVEQPMASKETLHKQPAGQPRASHKQPVEQSRVPKEALHAPVSGHSPRNLGKK